MGRSGNLCESLIVVGCVEHRDSHVVEEKYGPSVVTDVTVAVAPTVQGASPADAILHLQVRGGEVEGFGGVVAGEPALQQDACYTLYFLVLDDGTRAFQRDISLPARLEGVPREASLQEVWQGTCAAYAGEIYTDDPTWRLDVPEGVPREAMELVFRPPRPGDEFETSSPFGIADERLEEFALLGLAAAAVGLLALIVALRRRGKQK